MAKIKSIEITLIDLKPEVVRQDAIQSFVSQETPIVKITDVDGVVGYGYTYTIGTGGSSVVALLKDHLAPLLLGQEATNIERLWQKMLFHTHATAVGAITSLALAALDIALWDLKAKRAKLPLYQLLGGHKNKIKVYSTEGGWLHIPVEELVEDALKMKESGFFGSKLKVGKEFAKEDYQRLAAVREAVGDYYNIMVDANQSFTLSESIRRSSIFSPLSIYWLEEPLPADDIGSHKVLSQHSDIPIAVGESMYSVSQFKDYLAENACSVVQADVARVGGITPWLKIAHLAEAHNVQICPHFLMEIHVSLCAAVPNANWVEYIPQLTSMVENTMKIEKGYAHPSEEVGVGINWDFTAIKKKQLFSPIVINMGN